MKNNIGMEIIPVLTEKDILDKIDSGIITGGMIPKLMGCLDVIRRGVYKAHIIDGRIPHSLLLEIFTSKGIGTMIIKEINKQGVTVLLIEQNANMALKVATWAYVLETGNVTTQGTGEELMASEAIQEAYLGKQK